MASEGESESAVDDKLSGFVARILGQLSVSAWLPGALVATTGALLVALRSQKSVDVPAAVNFLLSDKPRVLILVVPVLVLSTLVVQAFSFEAIRILEGYGGRAGLGSWIRGLLIKIQRRRLDRVHKARLRLSKEAFDEVRLEWVDSFNSHVADLLMADAQEVLLSDAAKATFNEDDLEKADNLDWSTKCRAEKMARIERLQLIESEYPARARILPTTLGNVLRSTEDDIGDRYGDIESFALRGRDRVPLRIRRQHDQFRTRLDLYCTMVFVNIALATVWFVTIGPLSQVSHWTPATMGALAFLLFALVSYRAAISSARGYVVALRAIDATIQEQTSAVT